jgi:hypothetical protein
MRIGDLPHWGVLCVCVCVCVCVRLCVCVHSRLGCFVSSSGAGWRFAPVTSAGGFWQPSFTDVLINGWTFLFILLFFSPFFLWASPSFHHAFCIARLCSSSFWSVSVVRSPLPLFSSQTCGEKQTRSHRSTAGVTLGFPRPICSSFLSFIPFFSFFLLSSSSFPFSSSPLLPLPSPLALFLISSPLRPAPLFPFRLLSSLLSHAFCSASLSLLLTFPSTFFYSTAVRSR